MAQLTQVSDTTTQGKKRIFVTKKDVIKAIALTFIAFLFAGFQAAIYGMMVVPISKFFMIDTNRLVCLDSCGMWGQILAMAIGGFIISKIKAKNTLLLAGAMMIISSIVIVTVPVLPLYVAMQFLGNMAIGFTLVSCYYMIMGTAKKSGESEGILSILNVFFSAGFMISPIITGYLIQNYSWKLVFIAMAIMFAVFIVILLLFNVNEITDQESVARKKEKAEAKVKKEKFLTLPLVLTALAFFLFVYVEQIMNNLNQPRLAEDLGYQLSLVGWIIGTYTAGQLLGRLVIGKFILPKIKVHKYIIVSALCFGIFMLIYITLKDTRAIFIIMGFLGIADSCIYPSILGYGLDQMKSANPRATSFMVTCGSIGIPVGTGLSGIVAEHTTRTSAFLAGPILLAVVIVLICTVRTISSKKARNIAGNNNCEDKASLPCS
jgi:fucose permease